MYISSSFKYKLKETNLLLKTSQHLLKWITWVFPSLVFDAARSQQNGQEKVKDNRSHVCLASLHLYILLADQSWCPPQTRTHTHTPHLYNHICYFLVFYRHFSLLDSDMRCKIFTGHVAEVAGIWFPVLLVFEQAAVYSFIYRLQSVWLFCERKRHFCRNKNATWTVDVAWF